MQDRLVLYLDQTNAFCQRLNLNLAPAFRMLAFLFLFLMSFLYLSQPRSEGERLLLSDLRFFSRHSLYLAGDYNKSAVYSALAYPFWRIVPTYVSLRLLGIFAMGLLFWVLRRSTTFRYDTWAYLACLAGISPFLFEGSREALFVCAMSLFLTQVFSYCESLSYRTASVGLGLSGLIIAGFVSGQIYFYLIASVLGLASLYEVKWRPVKRQAVLPVVVALGCIVVSWTTFTRDFGFYQKTIPPPMRGQGNWIQREYLARQFVNEGDLPYGMYPSWAEVDEQIRFFGEKYLPRTHFEVMMADPGGAILEYGRDLRKSIGMAFGNTGFVFVFVMGFLIRERYISEEESVNGFVPWVLVSVIVLTSIGKITFVQPIWLFPALVACLVFFSEFAPSERYSHLYLTLSYLGFLSIIINHLIQL